MTTNLVNGKRYIGKHKATKFQVAYKGSGKLLRKAIKKYGIKNFKVELLETCETYEELNQKEQEYIKLYNAMESDMFYNIHHGGGGGDIAYYMSSDAMTKIRKDHAKYMKDKYKKHPEYWDHVGPKIGGTRSEKTKTGISNAQKRYWSSVSDEVKHERLSRSAKTRCTGRIWVTDGVIEKFIKPEDFEVYAKDNYYKGRLFRHRNRKCKNMQRLSKTLPMRKTLDRE